MLVIGYFQATGCRKYTHYRSTLWAIVLLPALSIVSAAETPYSTFNGEAVVPFSDRMYASQSEYIAEHPNDAFGYADRGALLFAVGRTDEALADYEKAVELAPDNGRYRCDMGQVLLRMGKISRALDAFERGALAFEKASDRSHLHCLLGQASCHLELGNRDKAIDIIERTRKLESPDTMYTDLHKSRGVLLLKIDRYEEAQEDLSQYVAKFVADPEAFYLLAQANFELGNYERAASHVSKAIEMRPDVVDGYRLRARAYVKSGELDLAREDLRKIVRLGEEPGDALVESLTP